MLLNDSNTELLNFSVDLIEYLTAVNVLDNMIMNAINTIRKNEKRPNINIGGFKEES